MTIAIGGAQLPMSAVLMAARIGLSGLTDEAILRADGATKAQGSVVTITDAGIVNGATQINCDNLRLDGNTLSSQNANGDIVLDPNGTGKVQISDGTDLIGGSNIELGANRAADGTSFLDIHTAEATYPDFTLRLIRHSGANGVGSIDHRGTGAFSITTVESASLVLATTSTARLTVAATGEVSLSSATASSSPSTGSFTTPGGMGIGGGMYVGNNIVIASAVGSGTAAIELGQGRSADGAAVIDMHAAEGTYPDYALRIARFSGANGTAAIEHRGTGTLSIGSAESADVTIKTSNTDRLTINSGGGMTLADANNIAVGTTTGTKIGTATSQKLGFFNATPVAQPSATGETTGFTAGGGTNVTDASTFTGNVGSTAYRISDVVKNLKNLGLLAA